jgi:hypothetical protein
MAFYDDLFEDLAHEEDAVGRFDAFEDLDSLIQQELARVGPLIAPEAEPQVWRVVPAGRRAPTPEQLREGRPGRPLFRAAGRLGPGHAALSAALNNPGVFVRGTLSQARRFASRAARRVGGRIRGPERHGAGQPHFNIEIPGHQGSDPHVWYGRNLPRGPFFDPQPPWHYIGGVEDSEKIEDLSSAIFRDLSRGGASLPSAPEAYLPDFSALPPDVKNAIIQHARAAYRVLTPPRLQQLIHDATRRAQALARQYANDAAGLVLQALGDAARSMNLSPPPPSTVPILRQPSRHPSPATPQKKRARKAQRRARKQTRQSRRFEDQYLT